MLGHRGGQLPDLRGELVDRQFPADQCPEDPDPRAVSEHPKHLDGEIHLVIRQHPPTCLIICAHMQIVHPCGGGNSPTVKNDYYFRALLPYLHLSPRCRDGRLRCRVVLEDASPAAAHIEMFTDGPVQAGTGPVTLFFVAQSESPTVGILSVKTQLPGASH